MSKLNSYWEVILEDKKHNLRIMPVIAPESDEELAIEKAFANPDEKVYGTLYLGLARNHKGIK